MMRGSGTRSGQERIVLMIVGWVVVVVVGIGLVFLGYTLGTRRSPDTQPPTAVPTAAPPLSTPTQSGPAAPTPFPTVTPLPMATPVPTPAPATPTSQASPMAVAGENGVNVRSGPGTTFTKLGYLDPGSQVPIIGRHADWWQIEFNNAPGWVFGDIVTASNTDGVPEVQPPPSPTSPPPPPAPPATATPTSSPPTQPPADYRGLYPDSFQVEGAPGPYGVGEPIWFNLWITNRTSEKVEYRSLGVVVEETNQYQQSYSYSDIAANTQFNHRDRIIINEPGTYSLWLTIGFYDDVWFRLLGPVTVIVQ